MTTTKLTTMAATMAVALSASALAGTSSTAGVPNPAAALCDHVGGKLVMLETPQGQDGFCELGRGLVGEWTLYAAVVGHRETEAARAYLAHAPFTNPHAAHPPLIGMPNPASVYCGQVGGDNRIVREQVGGELGICVFGDGSEIEEWTLFRGPEDSELAQLTDLLRP